ncbi:MAG TPA: hypothetical protein VNR89_22590 [Roseomonas sp.]|nr:hypothetical protein [Roseomonas sp.]
MKIRAAMLAALLGLGAGSAQAQTRWGDGQGYYDGVSTRVIVRSVRSRGLIPVSRVIRRGDLYYLNATDDYGRVRRVMVDAYSGRIVRIDGAVRAERGPGLPPPTRARPRYDDDARFEARRPPREVGEEPPRVIPADPDLAERRYPPRERTGSLPPLRPRAGLSPDRDGGPQAMLPPPPNAWGTGRSVEENPPRPSAGVPRRDRTRAAAVSPKHAPTPRPRPMGAGEVPAPEVSEEAKPDAPAPREAAVPPVSKPDAASEPVQRAPEPSSEPAEKSPETGAEPAEGESGAAPDKPAGEPRVILPGGPMPKAERTPDTRPGRRAAGNDAQAQAPSEAEPAARAPEAKPQTESPQAATPEEKPATGGMPPMQGLD